MELLSGAKTTPYHWFNHVDVVFVEAENFRQNTALLKYGLRRAVYRQMTTVAEVAEARRKLNGNMLHGVNAEMLLDDNVRVCFAVRNAALRNFTMLNDVIA